jgi:hypothetical protein
MTVDYLSFFQQHVVGLKKIGKSHLGWCPFHADEGSKMRGFSLNIETGLWRCFSCRASGNAISFCSKKGLPSSAAPDYDPSKTTYRYADGISKVRVHKPKENKTESFWEGTNNKGLPHDMKPYNSDAVEDARTTARPLWICEGEKDAMTLLDIGELAIAVPSAGQERTLDNVDLKGLSIIIACDNDPAGRTATRKIAMKSYNAQEIKWDEDALLQIGIPQTRLAGFDITDLMDTIKDKAKFLDYLLPFVIDSPKTRSNLDPRVTIDNVYTPEKAIMAYREHVQDLKKIRFITGVKPIDNIIRGVGGGELLYIIARAGSFKTAMLQNLLLNYIHNSSWGAMFFSIEMPIPSVTERFLQMTAPGKGKDIEEIFKNEEAHAVQKGLEEKYYKDTAGLYIVPTGVSINNIGLYKDITEGYYGAKIGLVGIDYLGLMDTEIQGKEYEVISKLAKDCKGLAKNLNVPVVVISQTSREGGGTGTQRIRLTSGRGSGAIEESADFILGLWQHETTFGNDIICEILKNRKGGKNSQWKLDFDEEHLKLGSEADVFTSPTRARNKAGFTNGGENEISEY